MMTSGLPYERGTRPRDETHPRCRGLNCVWKTHAYAYARTRAVGCRGRDKLCSCARASPLGSEDPGGRARPAQPAPVGGTTAVRCAALRPRRWRGFEYTLRGSGYPADALAHPRGSLGARAHACWGAMHRTRMPAHASVAIAGRSRVCLSWGGTQLRSSEGLDTRTHLPWSLLRLVAHVLVKSPAQMLGWGVPRRKYPESQGMHLYSTPKPQ